MPQDLPDLRLPALGMAAWLTALVALSQPPGRALLLWTGAMGALAIGARLGRSCAVTWVTLAGLAVVTGGVLAATLPRVAQVGDSPIVDLARVGTRADVVGRVASDPRAVQGGFEPRVAVRLDVREVAARGHTLRLRAPVLVLGGPAWTDVRLGSQVELRGRLVSADDSDLSALLVDTSDPRVRSPPTPVWRAAEIVRAALRASVADRPDDQRALVPALVDGDDGDLDAALADDFRVVGLTHLTAVSGTNLTLIVGFLLVIARWAGVRGRWLALVATLGITGFVVLARPEPSVLRAAVMGSVGLLALGVNGTRRGLRALGAAVVLLVLLQPELARSAGFALSVLATAGIVVLAPGWADLLARWCPRWLAVAVAVPTAAQIACTPVVAALSGQVSLVAVAANLVVAPVVGPATVCGLGAGLVGVVWAGGARLLALPACWCVAWIAHVARAGADLPLPALAWGTGTVALVLLSLLCVALVLAMPSILRRPWSAGGCVVVLVLVIAVRWPGGGPPSGWVMVSCDVGQGDAGVLNAGGGAAVVIDAGPDPAAVDRCLDWLGVTDVPLVVLTHFHADHVDGLPGVLDGRRVGAIWTTSLLDPPEAVDDVQELADDAGIPVSVTQPAGPVSIGDLTIQQVWPAVAAPHPGPGDGSTANDASVVLVVQVRGVRLLLTGDVEPPGQAVLARTLGDLDVDVLKVPHHGSRYQDLDWLTSLRPELALVSVGADNDYGHPATSTLDALAEAGAQVARTDEDGDLVVVPAGAGVRLIEHRS